jgi:DNA-directed RNA polymerase subunit RPC12/RpoP
MKDNEYKCASCQNIYEKGWSDEEAEKEVKEIWGEIPQEQRVVICDDCFNRRSPAEVKEMGKEY